MGRHIYPLKGAPSRGGSRAPNSAKIGQTVAEIVRFCDLQADGCCYLGFSKIWNFYSQSAVGSQWALPCQISSKSVEQLLRYGDLTVMKMAALCHLVFLKFKLTNFASPCQILWTSVKPLLRYRDFCDFQDGAHRYLGFFKYSKL